MSTLAANPPVRLRPDDEGVQFTPFGLVPLGEARLDTGMMGSALPPTDDQVPARPAAARHLLPASVAPAAPSSATPSAPLTPGALLKQAKGRIKELRAFLRTAKKAELELKELERLVAAAKKPLAPVRDIRRSAG